MYVLFDRHRKQFICEVHKKIQYEHAKLERVTKFGTRERESWYAKKSFEKARGNAERKEEMKERWHASRKGPALVTSCCYGT